MPRWVEHESEDDAASTSDEDDTQVQQASPQQAAKRKAPALEAGPSSNKKVKLSISLSRAKQECHVRQLHKLGVKLLSVITLLHTVAPAGMRPEGPLCRVCRVSLSRLSQQALLLVQAARTHHNDLPI